MNKDIKKLLLVNIFLAISDGIFYNFLEMWLSNNALNTHTISTVLSLASLITVSIIFLSSNLIKPHKLKNFVIMLMGMKSLILSLLFILYQSNLNITIKFLVMFEYAIDVEICASMYPLISKINKDDKLYAKRKLLYEIFYYIAAILSAVLLGKTLTNLSITYNTYAIIASISILISALFLVKTDVNKYSKEKNIDTGNDILLQLNRQIKNDEISVNYLLFIIFNDISYYTLVGILMTILTKELGFEPVIASYIKLAFCVLAVGIATLILYKLTSKNNYINLSVKYGGRIISYLIASIFTNKYTIIAGLMFTVLTSSAYTHVVDAPYINRFDSSKQLPFSNLCNMIGYFCKAIGTLICGFCLTYGLKYNFIIALIFTSICTLFAYQACYKRSNERSEK